LRSLIPGGRKNGLSSGLTSTEQGRNLAVNSDGLSSRRERAEVSGGVFGTGGETVVEGVAQFKVSGIPIAA
jgi:hypothetical protein